MERWRGRIALVTGAAVGIGAAITTSLVEAGMKVIGCGRDVEKIQDLATDLKMTVGALLGGSLLPLRCDVSKEESILMMFETIKEMYGGVDICINCAGFSHPEATLLEGQSTLWRHMLEVNVVGASIVVREAVKTMRERGVEDGHIIYINSTDIHSTSHDHFFPSTQAAMRRHSEDIRKQLRQLRSRIRVTCISPGPVKSEEDGGQNQQGVESCDVAAAVLYAIGAPKHVQVCDVILCGTEEDVSGSDA